tara:strand:- start:167 stop:598 length:432 start_codon:yes stop_codon:yes gene_type:complete
MRTTIIIALIVIIAYLLYTKRPAKGEGNSLYVEDEIQGCNVLGSCNFDDLATTGTNCIFPVLGYDCEGNYLLDMNSDGEISVADMLVFLGGFGNVCPSFSEPCVGDFNNDYAVTTQDLLIFLSEFGMTVPEANAWINDNLNLY